MSLELSWCGQSMTFSRHTKDLEAKQLQKIDPGYSGSSLLLYMNKQKVTNFSFSCFAFKMQIKIPDTALLLFPHLFVLGVFFFPSSNTLLLNQFSVRLESQHSCNPLLTVQMKQLGIHCLAKGNFGIICWHQDFSFTCVSVSSHRDISWKLI